MVNSKGFTAHSPWHFTAVRVATVSECARQRVRTGISNKTLVSPFHIQFGFEEEDRLSKVGQPLQILPQRKRIWALRNIHVSRLFQEIRYVNYPQIQRLRMYCSRNKEFHYKKYSSNELCISKLKQCLICICLLGNQILYKGYT